MKTRENIAMVAKIQRVLRRSVFLLVTLTLIINFFTGCTQSYISAVKVSEPTSVEIEELKQEIKRMVRELEYSKEVADNFANMVIGWQDGRGYPVLYVWKKQLGYVRNEYAQSQINENELAKYEESVTRVITQRMSKEIRLDWDKTCFELDDVIKYKKAVCLGYSQLFYIVANSIGLSTKPIFVKELRSGVRLGVTVLDEAHITCIVSLTNGKKVMVELVTIGSFVSNSFFLERQFENVNNYWQLKDKTNPLKLHQKIRIVDKQGLIVSRYNNRGMEYTKLGQDTQAIFEYVKAIRLNPAFAEVYFNRGNAYRNLDQHAKAILDYNKAIELDRDFVAAYINRGVSYRRLHQYDKSIADYNKAITLNPEEASVYVNRAGVYIDLNEPLKALSDCSKAIELNSQLGEAYYQRAICYAELRKFKEAKEDLCDAIAWNPDFTELVKQVRNSYGLALSDEEILAEARKPVLIMKINKDDEVEVAIPEDVKITGFTPDGGFTYEQTAINNVKSIEKSK